MSERDSLLGAVADAHGVTFRLDSAHATRAWVALFDRGRPFERERIPLESRGNGRWEAHVDGLRAGQRYGFRVDGPWAPHEGHLFDLERLLIDPRSARLEGELAWHPALGSDAPPRSADTAQIMPRAMVIDDTFDWGDDAAPRTAWERSLIYEAHVRGLTMRHPEVPEALRGTYLGLSSEPIVEHLRALSVTAIELLPVAASVPERRLLERGRTNYWGYSPISFMAPNARYASPGADPVLEFRAMVKALHAAGIEVILDVCLGHSAETDAVGMTLGPRGLDNRSYYRLHGDGSPVDWTGCGNTFDVSNPLARSLVIDSLRWWARDMRVDGFRLDQAVVLGRDEEGQFSRDAPFFREIASDPTLSRVKWIAEPWDLGPGGYRLGDFPAPFVEWNDRFRGCIRSAWRGDAGRLPELATRLTGSSDIFPARGPLAGAAFIACHDGMTLQDLVSHERKHNDANGEANRDGSDDNRSRNWGVEGATADPSIRNCRERVKRSLLATLAISRGVPLLAHGDEMGRSQRGNNNAYCHDSELTWMDWALDGERRSLLEFARAAFALRRAYPALSGSEFLSGQVRADGSKDVTWLDPSGREMNAADWHEAGSRAFAMRFVRAEGEGEGEGEAEGELLVLLNPAEGRTRFELPGEGPWREILNSARSRLRPDVARAALLAPFTLVVLERK